MSSSRGNLASDPKAAPVLGSTGTTLTERSDPFESKPELHDLLRQLYRCVKNKKKAEDTMPEEPKRLSRTSPETLDTFKLMDRFVQDAESMMTFSSSLIVKEFVLDVVVDLVKSSRSDEFTKMCLGIFKKLVDYDFSEEEDKFVFEDQVRTVYSPVFIRLIPHLNDIAIEESFYADDEDDMSAFQNDMLSLLFYMFKTLSITKLVRLGLKPRHLQFIIIHFTNSHYIPRLIHSIAANLDAKTVLDDDDLDQEVQMIDESVLNEQKLFINNIYSITVRSCLLLHRYHSGIRETSPILRQAFWHLASYAAKRLQETASEATFHKMARKVVGHFRRKLSQQINTPYLASDHDLLCDYMKMIEFNIGNMASAHRCGLAQKLMSYVKRVLEKLTNHSRCANYRLPGELVDCCFGLVNKLIQISRDEFIAVHLKNIDTTWNAFLMLDNKMAFAALVTLLEVQVRKAPFMMFVRRFLNAATNRITEPNCQVLLFLKPLLILYQDYTNDPLICEERRIKSLMDSYRAVLRKRSASNTNYLNGYLELVESLLRVHSNTSAVCPSLVQEVMYTLESMLLSSFDFELNPETTSRCLNIISLVQVSCSNVPDMSQYGNMLYQLLSLIQLSRRDGDLAFNYRLESLKDQLSALNWIA